VWPRSPRAWGDSRKTHFLVAQSKALFPTEATERIDRQQGKALYQSVGCVACHGARDASAGAPRKPKRNGEIFLIDGVDAPKPIPSFHRFATGLDEVIMKVAPDGRTTAFASGLRGPGGIGFRVRRAMKFPLSTSPVDRWVDVSRKALAASSPTIRNWRLAPCRSLDYRETGHVAHETICRSARLRPGLVDLAAQKSPPIDGRRASGP
jgi:hypothetical protein